MTTSCEYISEGKNSNRNGMLVNHNGNILMGMTEPDICTWETLETLHRGKESK